jgi:hypothetical protein
MIGSPYSRQKRKGYTVSAMERGYFYGKNQKNLLDVVKKHLLGGMDEA